MKLCQTDPWVAASTSLETFDPVSWLDVQGVSKKCPHFGGSGEKACKEMEPKDITVRGRMRYKQSQQSGAKRQGRSREGSEELGSVSCQTLHSHLPLPSVATAITAKSHNLSAVAQHLVQRGGHEQARACFPLFLLVGPPCGLESQLPLLLFPGSSSRLPCLLLINQALIFLFAHLSSCFGDGHSDECHDPTANRCPWTWAQPATFSVCLLCQQPWVEVQCSV